MFIISTMCDLFQTNVISIFKKKGKSGIVFSNSYFFVVIYKILLPVFYTILGVLDHHADNNSREDYITHLQ
jgi:hypothetical protein